MLSVRTHFLFCRKAKCGPVTFAGTVCFAFLILNGCVDHSAQIQEQKQRSKQILTVNESIDKWYPGNARLSRSFEVAKVKNAGFDFLKDRSLKDFENLFSVAEPISKTELMNMYVIGDGIGKWISDHKPGTEYFMFDTDLWNLGDGTETMDILIVACVEEKVTNWRLFAVCGY